MHNLLTPQLSKAWSVHHIEIDKVRIRYAVFKPTERINRFLVLINGRNEFIEKYSYIVEDLNLPPDCGLITWDHRGQGASDGQTSHCESFDSYINDARLVLKSANPSNLPFIILGHSMGGLISVYGIIKQAFQPDYLLLSAPFLGMPEKPLPHFVSRPLAEALVSLGLGDRYVRHKGALKKEEFFTNQKTHSRLRFNRMKASPYPAKSVTYAWVQAAFIALETVHQGEQIKGFKVPVHIMVGDRETVVDIKYIHTWVKKLRTQHPDNVCELTVIRGAKHELLSEAKYYYDQTLSVINSILIEWSQPRRLLS
ncbi:MAG: alpha/beta hydrolase [Oligoflexales bacterium]|nr:alpha/beta hydrolase [Oligoflexales bacterium]